MGQRGSLRCDRAFSCTAEFLWQEGHTVHATPEEAMDETRLILKLYADFAENWLAMPVLCGEDQRTLRRRMHPVLEAAMQTARLCRREPPTFSDRTFPKPVDSNSESEQGREEFDGPPPVCFHIGRLAETTMITPMMTVWWFLPR